MRHHVDLGEWSPGVDAYCEHRAQDAAHHIGETLLRQLTLRVGLLERLHERLRVPVDLVDLETALLVEPLERELPAQGGAPVGHHPSRVGPRALEHVLEQYGVAAGVVAVNLVVAGHHRAWLRTLDRDLERQQVGFTMRSRVNDRVQPVAVGLVAVERVVLDRRDHSFALDAVDRLGGEHCTQAADPRIDARSYVRCVDLGRG